MPDTRLDGGGSFIDELAHAGPEHLDPAYVETYERKAAFDPGPDLALLREHGLGPDGTLVDLGAGTGVMALAAARHCRRVVAVDVSAAMLDRLCERAPANVEVVRAGFLSYRHAGEPADAAYSRHALHHLPDLWKPVALRRLAEVLRPGGVLLLRDLTFSFGPEEAEERLGAWLHGAASTPAQGWTREELETHLRDEFSTYTWHLEPMLERAGFAIEQAMLDPSGIYAGHLCRRI
jgi:ubiquinone/menaquinone biosynthesis C-methylase UbiE